MILHLFVQALQVPWHLAGTIKEAAPSQSAVELHTPSAGTERWTLADSSHGKGRVLARITGSARLHVVGLQ